MPGPRLAGGIGRDPWNEHRNEGTCAVPAARVFEQFADGDRCEPRIDGRAGGRRQVAEKCEDLRIQVEPALLDELHDRDRRHGLRPARDADQRIGLDERPGRLVGIPEPAGVHEPAVLGDDGWRAPFRGAPADVVCAGPDGVGGGGEPCESGRTGGPEARRNTTAGPAGPETKHARGVRSWRRRARNSSGPGA